MALIFDLDGTLVDSAPDIREAINGLLWAEGLEPLDLRLVTSFIGHGTRRLVERAYAHRGQALDVDALDERQARFEASYGEACAVRTWPYPGVPATMAALARRGLRLGICTNKPTELARRILVSLNLARYLACVVGGDADLQRKPDPEPLLTCASRLGVLPERCLYVGDSLVDARTAQAARMPLALVTYGYEREPLEGQNAVALIDSFADLLRLMELLEL